MTFDNFFLFKFAKNGFALIIGMFIIPLISIIFTCMNSWYNQPLALVVFLLGDIVIPILCIIGMNVKNKFNIVLRVFLTVIASVVVIFNEFACYCFYPKKVNNYSSYTSSNSKNVEEIAGITIEVPKYFDVRKENYAGFEVAYYPETELAKATIGFKTLVDEVTSEQVKNSKDNIVSNWKESFGNDIKVVDYEIDGHYVLTASNEKSGTLSKCAAVVNDNDEKIMFVVLTVDADDVSGYDYANDFDNMIKNASIPKKVSVVSETTQSTIENQINNVETTEIVPKTTKAKDYKNSEVGDVVNEYNNEIDKAKSELNNEIDKAADELKDEMGLAGKLFGGYVDDYADVYKDAVNDFSDIYKDAADEYGKIYDDILNQFGY